MITELSSFKYHTYHAIICFPGRQAYEQVNHIDTDQEGLCWALRDLYKPVYAYSVLQQEFVDRTGCKLLPNDKICWLYGVIDTNCNYGTLKVNYAPCLPPTSVIRTEFVSDGQVTTGNVFSTTQPLLPRRTLRNLKGDWRIDSLHVNRNCNITIRYKSA